MDDAKEGSPDEKEREKAADLTAPCKPLRGLRLVLPAQIRNETALQKGRRFNSGDGHETLLLRSEWALCGKRGGYFGEAWKEARGATQEREARGGGQRQPPRSGNSSPSVLSFVCGSKGRHFRIKTHEGESWFRPQLASHTGKLPLKMPAAQPVSKC